MRYNFIGVGDTFKSSKETEHFHRGESYKVSHTFNDLGNLRIFITDKNGYNIEVVSETQFDITGATVSNSEARQLRARLDFFWENTDTNFTINKSYHYDLENTEFFNLRNSFQSNKDGIIAKIYRYKKVRSETGGWLQKEIPGTEATFKTKDEYYKYFKNVDLFNIDCLHSSVMSKIDFLYFMKDIPPYNESLLNLPETVNNTEINQYLHKEKPEFDEVLKICARVIFDSDVVTIDHKNIIYNIIEAFELLPKSYGVTSVSKLLMGKEKKKNATVEHLSGTCTSLKTPQMFTLCDMIDSFMHYNNIFISEDVYSTSEEWRGAYEFIGTKVINVAELTKIKNKLK